MKHIIIETDQIRIGLLRVDDEQYLYDLYEYPLSKEQCHIVACKFMNTKEELIHGVFVHDELIGIIELYHCSQDEAEIGYRTRISKRGNGYMKRAVKCFVENQKCFCKITARVNRRNHASIAVLEYAGFHMQQELPHELVYVWEKQED